MSQNVRQEVIASGWKDFGAGITTADVAWTAAELAAATVEALASTLCTLIEIPYGAANVELRFYGTQTDADANVVNIYGKRDNDGYYQLLATLTVTCGTGQRGSAAVLWADTIVEDTDATPLGSGYIASPADNSIARYGFTRGQFKQLAVIMTTKQAGTTNIGIEMAAFSG
jgi:hypothetical protein